MFNFDAIFVIVGVGVFVENIVVVVDLIVVLCLVVVNKS